MSESTAIVISAKHVRYFSLRQLEVLTEIDHCLLAQWVKDGAPKQRLEYMAFKLGMDNDEFRRGWELRRTDYLEQKQVQQECKALVEALRAERLSA